MLQSFQQALIWSIVVNAVDEVADLDHIIGVHFHLAIVSFVFEGDSLQIMNLTKGQLTLIASDYVITSTLVTSGTL